MTRAEVDLLREKLRSLEETLGGDKVAAIIFELTPQENAVFKALYERILISNNALDALASLNGRQKDHYSYSMPKVLIHRIRKKLAPHDIQILSSNGHGYYMTPEHQKKTKKLIAEYGHAKG